MKGKPQAEKKAKIADHETRRICDKCRKRVNYRSLTTLLRIDENMRRKMVYFHKECR